MTYVQPASTMHISIYGKKQARVLARVSTAEALKTDGHQLEEKTDWLFDGSLHHPCALMVEGQEAWNI